MSEPIVKLILSREDFRNTNFDCDEAGIHFEVITPTDGVKSTRVTEIWRIDKRGDGKISLVCQWERSDFKTDRIRFFAGTSGSSEYMSMKDFLFRITSNALIYP